MSSSFSSSIIESTTKTSSSTIFNINSTFIKPKDNDNDKPKQIPYGRSHPDFGKDILKTIIR